MDDSYEEARREAYDDQFGGGVALLGYAAEPNVFDRGFDAGYERAVEWLRAEARRLGEEAIDRKAVAEEWFELHTESTAIRHAVDLLVRAKGETGE